MVVSDPSQVGALQELNGHFYERFAWLRMKRNHPEQALEMLEAGRGQGLSRQAAATGFDFPGGLSPAGAEQVKQVQSNLCVSFASFQFSGGQTLRHCSNVASVGSTTAAKG